MSATPNHQGRNVSHSSPPGLKRRQPILDTQSHDFPAFMRRTVGEDGKELALRHPRHVAFTGVPSQQQPRGEDQQRGDGSGASRKPPEGREDNQDGRPPHEKSPTTQGGNISFLLGTETVDGVWNPLRNTDVTVHLSLDLQDNLDDTLENLSHYYRLGNFSRARELVAEELQDHLDKPYMLIRWAEILGQQGDYKTMLEMDSGPIRNLEDRAVTGKEARLLILYWDLLQLLARDRACKVVDDDGDQYMLLEGLKCVYEIMEPDCEDRDASSTETLKRVIDDWQTPVYDASTNLALLGILTEKLMDIVSSPNGRWLVDPLLDLSFPLAQSIMRNSPGNMKSRPFIRWMLAKSIRAEEKHVDGFKPGLENLESAEGLYYYRRQIELPTYVPARRENPGWRMDDAPKEFRDAVKLLVNTSREIGDYHTEAMCLTQLIRLTSKPAAEFEELCHLQKHYQQDLISYDWTLASGYLIYSPDTVTDKCEGEMTERLITLVGSNLIIPNIQWVLGMILYALKTNREDAENAYRSAYTAYPFITENLQILVDNTFPRFKQETENKTDTGSHPRDKANNAGHIAPKTVRRRTLRARATTRNRSRQDEKGGRDHSRRSRPYRSSDESQSDNGSSIVVDDITYEKSGNLEEVKQIDSHTSMGRNDGDISYRTADNVAGKAMCPSLPTEQKPQKAEPPNHDITGEETFSHAPRSDTEDSGSGVGHEDIEHVVRRSTFPTVESTEDLEAQVQGKGETLPATNDVGDVSVDKNEGVPTA
ncbi:hypothetical protein DL770_008374 [Monosporascus sp. CRB-9-2]|nr:hypothetical protein DL770_008374 [Monosporascus sp. CRB-9-2]